MFIERWLKIGPRIYNKFRVNEAITAKTLNFCNILIDADKIDILRVNIENPMEESTMSQVKNF